MAYKTICAFKAAFVILLFAVCFSFSGCRSRTLKVMSWNIWHAGHLEEYGSKACEGVIGLMKESGADVIMVIETYGASDMIADSLGFYHRLISDNLSVYSRYPIVKTYTFPDYVSTFNFGGVEINVCGQRVRVFNTWLHYLPDARLVPVDSTEAQILAWDNAGVRDEEIKAIIDVIQPVLDESDKIPVIMGGDFNIHSHLDWTEETKNMYRHGGAVVRWTVSSEMEKAGFRDSFREVNPDPVENIGTTWLAEADENASPVRQDRIDFIYCHGEGIRTLSSVCVDNNLGQSLLYGGKEFFYGSDHGFVLSEFKISR